MSLRCLFIATAYLAVVCAGLAFPSLAWVIGFSLANICVAVYAAARATVTPESRPFWLGYLAGIGAFFAVLEGVRGDLVNMAIAGPLWGWFHDPFSPFSPNGSNHYARFSDTATLALSIAVPFVVALAMKALLRKRDSEA